MATAPGRAGVAVLRVSGGLAGSVGVQFAGPLPAPRKAVVRTFNDNFGEAVDRGLLLWFPAPNSFTGEPVIEFHLHGGRAIADRMLQLLSQVQGVRAARAGEFTRRAFDNGRLDLTAVEGLADLVAAETEAQRRQALHQMEGRLGIIYESWRGRLLRALAYLEAQIDFSDEELPDGMERLVDITLSDIGAEILAHLADGCRGEILRRGFRIAILGAPNVGKSSLLNLLARREVAIVTPQAGTTRDVIEVNLDLGGYLVCVADTAGLRSTEDETEEEGIRRALRQAESADLRLLIFDAGQWPEMDIQTLDLRSGPALCVLNKIDLHPKIAVDTVHPFIPVSVKSGTGVEGLLQAIQDEVAARLGGGETPGLSRERHRRELVLCVESLDRARHPAGQA
ncbi:MAG: tRNA uridine-5-carboxymethylaminomethyl(34) synthesis GTPase MnmE, partial [Alphaproteobacteria bacterium]